MTNRNLEVFIAVAECGKMSQAAKELSITQSSVSQAISEIEKEYGVLLFDRLSRSLYLTDTGRSFLEYSKKAISLQAEIESFLRNTSQVKSLRIGATVTVGTCLISPIVNLLSSRMPGIRTQVTVANTHVLEAMLLKSKLDIGLVEGMIKHPDLIVDKAIDDDMVLICGSDHPFFGVKAVKAAQLEGQPFILREQGSGTRAQFEETLRNKHVTIDPVWECCSSEAIINAVHGGHGVSVLSRRLVTSQVSAGALWACDIIDAELHRTFDLVYHKDKLINPALQAFIDICRSFGLGDGKAHEKSR